MIVKTKPMTRQNVAMTANIISESSRSLSSSISVDNIANRVCTMLTSVDANVDKDSSNPLLSLVIKIRFCLVTAADKQTNNHTNSCS